MDVFSAGASRRVGVAVFRDRARWRVGLRKVKNLPVIVNLKVKMFEVKNYNSPLGLGKKIVSTARQQSKIQNLNLFKS